MTLLQASSSPSQSSSEVSISASRKRGPAPWTNEKKTLFYLKKVAPLTASSQDVSHLLHFSDPWGSVRAVTILEGLVRKGKVAKHKVHGETRYQSI